MTNNFALIGAAGYVAPRHIKAIKDTGNRLVAATDPHDAVGILDRHFLNVKYFPEIERFDRHLEKLKHDASPEKIDYVTICSPNYLHDAHVRLALRIGAEAICEKPLVINPWNLDYLSRLETEYQKKVNTILQLRVHPSLVSLKEKLDKEKSDTKHKVQLTYITGRGAWYDVSWKGLEERSGGVSLNIGVHFFDMLTWLFGKPQKTEVHLREKRKVSGFMELEKATVQWFLSVDFADLPAPPGEEMKTTHRSITLDGEEIDFTAGFTDLHTEVYKRTLSGNGFGIEDARPSIELVHGIRHGEIVKNPDCPHPKLAGK